VCVCFLTALLVKHFLVFCRHFSAKVIFARVSLRLAINLCSEVSLLQEGGICSYVDEDVNMDVNVNVSLNVSGAKQLKLMSSCR